MIHLYRIQAGLPFLDTLAAGLLARTAGTAPERLATTTILLPTRRAARAFRAACLRVAAPTGEAGLLLPRTRALAGLSAEDADELALPALLDLPPAVAPLRRQAVLTGFVQRLQAARHEPGTPEQAWALAAALAQLFDELALEETDPAAFESGRAPSETWLRRLAGLAPPEHAAHWETTLAFLRAALADWQTWLDAAGLLDIGPRRVLALRAQAAAWTAAPPPGPVIAAGIGVGGLIPAATDLLRVIARLSHGAVVLQGFDDPPDADPAIVDAPAHPDYGPLRLLAALGAARGDLAPWLPSDDTAHTGHGAAPAPCAPQARATLLGRALLPAAAMAAWQRREQALWQPALAGLETLAAPDAQAEAVAIALLLRETLEDPTARAALVTPDRDLARRVAAELARHGVVADDSAGQPLGESPAGGFLRLLATAVAEDLAPVPLLALLKHPLAAAGQDRTDWLRGVRALELAALRGARPGPGIAGLRAAVAAGPDGATTAQARAATLLDALDAALEGFAALPTSPARPPADLLAAHLAAAEALAATQTLPGGIRLYRGEEGEALAEHLAALAEALRELPPIAPAAWPALFDAALADATAPALHASRGRPAGPHPRVEILGLFEARLLSFDRVVLGALEEGIWPLATESGPWLSRPMRRELGLPPPEARIGRVAADFLHAACAAPTAFFSRANKRGGAPTVPARWLTRLETFLGGQTAPSHPDGLRLPPSAAPGWAAALDRPDRARPCARPAPRPPAAARPDRLSVTEVETLVADPYAYYAKRVLRLRPLDALDQEAGAADYGQLVHAAMARFIAALGGDWPGEPAARAAFAEAAEDALAMAAARPGLLAFWRPRLARIGEFVVAQEEAARQGGRIRCSLVECDGLLPLAHADGRTVNLTVRADRIDVLANGRLAILDYKTGQLPTAKSVTEGHRPQLPLEAAIAADGGFPGLEDADAELLVYWRLAGGGTPGEVAVVGKDANTIHALAGTALAGVRGLAERFLWGDAPFTARPLAGRDPAGTDYDHLARIGEWGGAAGDAS